MFMHVYSQRKSHRKRHHRHMHRTYKRIPSPLIIHLPAVLSHRLVRMDVKSSNPVFKEHNLNRLDLSFTLPVFLRQGSEPGHIPLVVDRSGNATNNLDHMGLEANTAAAILHRDLLKLSEATKRRLSLQPYILHPKWHTGVSQRADPNGSVDLVPELAGCIWSGNSIRIRVSVLHLRRVQLRQILPFEFSLTGSPSNRPLGPGEHHSTDTKATSITNLR